MWDHHQLPKIIFLEYNEQELVRIVLVQQAECVFPAMLKRRLAIKKTDYKTITQANQFEIKSCEHRARIFNTAHTSIIAEDTHFNFKLYWLFRAKVWSPLPRYLTQA